MSLRSIFFLAGRVWNQHLVAGLIRHGFVASTVDECVFYKGANVLLIYVDDGIVAGPDADEITAIIRRLKEDFGFRRNGRRRHLRLLGGPGREASGWPVQADAATIDPSYSVRHGHGPRDQDHERREQNFDGRSSCRRSGSINSSGRN